MTRAEGLKGESASPSIAYGVSLEEEPGLGALTLTGFLREVTESYPDNEVLVMYTRDGVVRWSYTDLWERSVEVARALLACGVGKNCRIGVLMTNRPEWLSSVFGIALAGGVATCFSTFSTASELDYMLKTSGVSVLLLEKQVLKKDFSTMLTDLEPSIGRVSPGAISSRQYPFLRHLAMIGEEEEEEEEGFGAFENWDGFIARGSVIPQTMVDAVGKTVSPSDPGAILFSSGSTSKPKGILNSHRGIAIQLWRWARIYGMGPGVRTWTANGFFWSGNFVMAIGGTLSRGGAIVLQSTFDAREALRLIEAEKVSCPFVWPHQWVQLEAAPNWESTDLSSIHYAERGSSFLKHSTVRTDWFEPIGAYGTTETFTIITSCPACTTKNDKGGDILPGNIVKIVDPDTKEIVPRGQAGEIAVKGKTLMMGYLGIPLDESVDEYGFFHTGDSGYLDDQRCLVFEGRLSDVIKTGGANVSPLEVDNVLSQHPGVKVAKTVGLPHKTFGEIVVACIVPHAGESLTESCIREFAKDKLASYKVPGKVLFFDESDLRLTGSNKIKTSDIRYMVARRLAEP